MRLSLVLSVLRPAGPVAIGVSLGFTLSLLSVTWVEEPCGPPPRPAARPPPSDGSPGGPPAGGLHNGNAARRPNAVPGGLGADSWEPRVVPYRPPSPGRAAKKAVRCGAGAAGAGRGPAGASGGAGWGGRLPPAFPGPCRPLLAAPWAAAGRLPAASLPADLPSPALRPVPARPAAPHPRHPGVPRPRPTDGTEQALKGPPCPLPGGGRAGGAVGLNGAAV